jgi:hypothetical protein
MPAADDYHAPPVAAMAVAQERPDALRLLLAQRRMYRTAKRWQALRWFGVLVLAVAAPFVALIWPSSAVAVGGLAGIWLFAGRTALAGLEARGMTRAACVQEDFDLLVFAMPRTTERSDHPTAEDIAAVVGDDARFHDAIGREKLRGWYEFAGDDGTEAVALAQRSNAAYTDRLLRTMVATWCGAALLWFAVLLVIAGLSRLSFAAVLLGVVFPVLPSLLDVADYIRSTWRAAHDRADLARSIERRLGAIEDQDLLVWQNQLFTLRQTTPQLPEWLYWLTRKRNERASKAATRSLARPR